MYPVKLKLHLLQLLTEDKAHRKVGFFIIKIAKNAGKWYNKST